jgi:ribosomal protein S18 acetylase RimI-like enzyme
LQEWIRILDNFMDVQSLGYRTDLFFPAFEGEVIDRGSYLVIKTPANPTFYFGNFLLFEDPPGEGDFRKWQELFAEEIGKPPHVQHKAFGWDTTKHDSGVIQPFLDNGYHLEVSVVLTARRDDLNQKTSLDFTIRQLVSNDDWVQSVENQVNSREPSFSKDGYRVYRQGQAKRCQKMVAAGLGAWFGAFTADRLVSDLGIFCSGDLGRYQAVQTHHDFRRQGIAWALVFQAAQYAFANHDIDRLVIVAEANSPAQGLYQSIGFQLTENQMGIWKAEGEE